MKKWMIYTITWLVVMALIAGVYQFAVVPATQPEPNSEEAVRDGSKVQVEYTGMLAPEYGGGLVFDTSMYDVAVDNNSYPKTPTFQMRSKDRYTPLMVHVGGKSDKGYIQVIDGFSEGLIGMHPGESKVITIPPEKGYGYGDPNLIETHRLTHVIPLREEYPEQKFVYLFGAHPKVGMMVENPVYHWPMHVDNVLGGYAIVSNLPEKNETYSAGPWDVRVMDMESVSDNGNGTITIKNLLYPEDAYHIKGNGTNAYGKQGTFVVTGVDLENDTYTIDYNDLTKGRTLIFTVKLISIDVY